MSNSKAKSIVRDILVKKKGAGIQTASNRPQEKAFFQAVKGSYEKKAPKEIASNLKLIVDTPTLDAYLDPQSLTILLGIRGTDVKSFKDLKADASLIANRLSSSKRYKKDKEVLEKIIKQYPPEKYNYYASAHSLSGAIATQFRRDFPFIKYAVSYNSAFQPSDLLNQDRSIKRLYTPTDFLYNLGGKMFRNVQLVPADRASGFFARLRESLIPSGIRGHKLDNFKKLYGGGKSKRAGYVRAIVAKKKGMPPLDVSKVKNASKNLYDIEFPPLSPLEIDFDEDEELDSKKIDLDTTTFDRFDEIIKRRKDLRQKSSTQRVFDTKELRKMIGEFASKTDIEQAKSLASAMSLLYITSNVYDFISERKNKKTLGGLYMKEMKDFGKKVLGSYQKIKKQFEKKSEDSGEFINDLENAIIDYYAEGDDESRWENWITRLTDIPIEESKRYGYEVDVEPFTTEIQEEINFRYEMAGDFDEDDDFDEDAIYDEKMDEIKDRIKNRMEQTKKLVNKKIKDINAILSLPTDRIDKIVELSVNEVG